MRRSLFVAPLLSAAALVEIAAGCSKEKPVVLIQDAAPLNATPLANESVAKQVNPQNLPAYSGPTGSVEGTVFVKGHASTIDGPASYTLCKDEASAIAMYGHTFREGAPAAPEGPRWLADAVVAVTGYGNYFIPETKEARNVTIEGCAFSARTYTLTFGQRLDVKNVSDTFWTPELDPKTTSVLMMAVPRGDAIKLFPKREGYYHLIDRDRRWALADVYVLRQPLHTVTVREGKYRIDGIPVGKVTVNATHPHLGKSEASQAIEIKADAVAHVDLTLENNAAALPPASPGDGGVRPTVIK